MLVRVGAAPRRPERLDLRQDPLAELVAGPREREGRVRVQALEPAGARLTGDPARQLGSKAALLLVPALGAFSQLRVLAHETAPALDAARGLEPGDRGDEVAAGDVVGGRERLARLVERCLLGYGRATERAAHDHAPKRARGPADLPLDDGAVIFHRARS